MKIQTMIVLIALVYSVNGASSEPYFYDDQQRLESPRANEEGVLEDDAVDDESVFARPGGHLKLASPHHHMNSPFGITLQPIQRDSSETEPISVGHRSNETRLHRQSMQQYSIIDPGAIFDRDAFLRAHVQGRIEDEERFGRATRACRWCNITWNGLGGVSTATSLVVSAIGACEYMDPRLANMLTIGLGIASGACIWAGTQAKKISHQYHEEQNDIQLSLGVPNSWLDREVRVEIDRFNPRGETETAHAPAAH